MATKTTVKNSAAGKVNPATEAAYNAASNGYTPSANVIAAQAALQSAVAPTYQNSYEGQLSNIYNSIMNRDKFNYNVNADALYSQYKDQYIANGKQAMNENIARANALTGGYGSSYAGTVGQQSYQRYLQELNNAVPDLYKLAYQRYQGENQDLLNKYSVSRDISNLEYQRYRDAMGDYHSDRNFNLGMYQDERDFDYKRFANDRAYASNEYWNQRNSASSTSSSGGGSSKSTKTEKATKTDVSKAMEKYGYTEDDMSVTSAWTDPAKRNNIVRRIDNFEDPDEADEFIENLVSKGAISMGDALTFTTYVDKKRHDISEVDWNVFRKKYLD